MNLLDKFHFKDKNGIQTTMEICDSFSRNKIEEVNSKLNLKQNITDNTLSTTNKNIVGAINEINSDLTNGTCTNLLNPTAQTQTRNGVTFTNNGDGTYTVNGTASKWTLVNLNYVNSSTLSVPVGTYKLTGTPPNNRGVSLEVVSPGGLFGSDAGGGRIFTVPQDTTASWVRITIDSNRTCDNLLFKPMITTDLNAKYDDYVPYTGDSGRLNEDVSNKQDKTDNALATTAKTVVGAINEINSDLSDKTFTVTAANQSINLTSFNCRRFGSMAKISMYGTTVRQLEANKAYFIPNLYINGMQNVNLYGCGITRTTASADDGAVSYSCVVNITGHNVCFTPLVTIPNNFGMAIELLCYLVPQE